jgi:hypothetical protein
MARIWIVFSVLSSFLFAQAAPSNQANTTAVYQAWVNYDTGNQTVNDVVHLRGGWDGFTDFCDQIISNVSVVPGPSGKWYIYGYGDHKLSVLDIGDACWMIVRNADGKYDLVPNCRRPGVRCLAPVYTHMEPRLHVEAVPTYNWDYVGWMGQRMAVFYSAQADARGNHYFALVKIGDLGDPNLEQIRREPRDDRHYFVWAVSADGIMWQYEKVNPDFSDCLNSTLYLTDVSTNARPILYRECFQSDPAFVGSKSNEVFHHYALFYSDPAQRDVYGHYGDGKIYLIFGYTPSGSGVHNLVVRFPFSLSSCIGRSGDIEIFRDDDPPGESGDGPYCSGPGRWETLTKCDSPNICDSLIIPSDFAGCIPKAVSDDYRSGLFNDFVPGMAVPFDWITLKDRWGNFYASMLAYDSATSFSTDRIAVRFTRDIRPPFRWSEERELNTCYTPATYTTCHGGGNNVGLYQPPYSQFPTYYNADGSPAKLFAFYAHTKHDCRPGSSCLGEAGGILPATVELTSIPYFQEVQQLKVQKGVGDQLILTWNNTGALGYEILEGTLGRYGPSGFQQYGYAFNPYGYNNNPSGACAETVKYDHYQKCSWKDSNDRCCTWVDTSGHCCDDAGCFSTTPLSISASPVKLYPEDNGTARYFLVLPYCHRKDEGSSSFSYSGVERPAPICQQGDGSTTDIDCWHYYFHDPAPPGQDIDYGRMHWPQTP